VLLLQAHLQAEVDHLTGQHAGSGGAVTSRVIGAASNLQQQPAPMNLLFQPQHEH
jgi:hypothetical protein